MERPITGFHRDDEGHWVAELSCGHRQHTRHAPPFFVRQWVLSESGRSSRIGTALPCARCDRREIPEDYVPLRSTRTFTEHSIPSRLLTHHSTSPGVWGLIEIESGELGYICEPPLASAERLTPGTDGIVVPELEHHIEPTGAVSFRVTFWRRATPPS